MSEARETGGRTTMPTAKRSAQNVTRLGLLVLVAVMVVAAAPIAGGKTLSSTVCVSVRSGSTEPVGTSGSPAVTPSGRYVAFEAMTSHLVDGDTNGRSDVFVHDRSTGETTRVSVRSDGGEATTGDSNRPSISADGRYVAFESEASDLVPNDTNRVTDVFVHDRETGATTRVSVDRYGTAAKWGDSGDASISADGRYVAFESDATNLDPIIPDVSGDTNASTDVFVHDRETGDTRRVSVSSEGEEGNDGSGDPSIDADGRYVAFESRAENLVPVDNNFEVDVFVHDLATGETELASVRENGHPSLHGGADPSISADGRYVAFDSWGPDFVSGDTNFETDVFVHDRATGQNTRVSVRSDGSQATYDSFQPAISPSGQYVAFESYADDLVAGDSNGDVDVFVHSCLSGNTTRMSVSSGGGQGNGHSWHAAVTAGGGRVAFESQATNLVADDDNYNDDVFVRIAATQFTDVHGETRYDTAVEISQASFPDGLWANDEGKRTVIIARGDLWPDALGGGALAGVYRGPILLTLPTLLPDTVMNEIGRLRATDAIILGGTGAVDPSVEQALAGKLGADHVTRIGGATRYETAELIAEAVADAPGSRFDGTALVATGLIFPDSLAGSPMAAKHHWPVFLAPPSGLTPSTQAAMDVLKVTDAVVLGETGAVPQAVEDDLKARLAGDVTRLGGATRYETAVEIAEWAVEHAGLFWHLPGAADGGNFPDALAAGPSQGKKDSVMLLVQTGGVPSAAAAALTEHTDMVAEVTVYGGPGAVSDETRAAIEELLE